MAARPERSTLTDSSIFRGIVAIIFGLAILIWPAITLRVLVTLFAAYALISGALALLAAQRQSSHHEEWWSSALEGVIGIAAGLAILFWPGTSLAVVLYVIAAWAIVSAIPELIGGFTRGDWLAVGTGVVLLLLGITLVGTGASTLASVAQIIGIFAIIWGGLTLARAFAGTARHA